MKMKKNVKQSFTLVELSIVLLILSLLVGSLLVGRKIVDRAKLQRIMFEFDYYKKNFTLFQDTFEVLPSNVDTTTCKRYGEFSQAQTEADMKAGTIPTAGTYCVTTGDNARVVEGYVSASVMSNSENWLTFLTGMRFMKSGKVVDTVKYGIAEKMSDTATINVADVVEATVAAQSPVKTALTVGEDGAGHETEAGQECKSCVSNAAIKSTQGVASFDTEGAFSFVGVPENVTEMYYIRGSNMSEMKNETYRTRIGGKNVLAIYRNVPSSSDETRGISNTTTGILSSSMANMLDVKMDDGQPGTGSVLALKNGYAFSTAGSAHASKVCYNNTVENVSGAFYLDDSDTKYGCNMLYLMQSNE
jgi:hypothetical protein